MNHHLFDALDLARLMQREKEPLLLPTRDQQRIIEHPLGGATLVVAGAGSGKTETMSNRVVWLVANGFVAPAQVLGLTFTKKAAGELAERLRDKLFQFIERGSRAAKAGHLTIEQEHAVRSLDEAVSASLDLPEVSTYNSFAVSIAQEFGASAAATGKLIDDATAWGLARSLVVQSTDDELRAIDVGVDRMTQYVLDLDRAAGEHLVTLERVSREVTRFLTIETLPRDQKALDAGVQGNMYADVTKVVENTRVTSIVARLAAEYAALKAERGLLEYSDQVALALETVKTSPDASATLRARHRIIMLDEMQDTSVAQTRLLSSVYRGTSVMAVGDPHQSIYGWRGASSESLSGFHRSFQNANETEQAVLSLSTSWRNASKILDAANEIAAPLRATAPFGVPTLGPRKDAPDGTVDAQYFETIQEEIAAVAHWVSTTRDDFLVTHGRLPTAALLFRSRKQMGRYANALSEAGVPNQIVGVGGLLTTPEVADIIAVLRCIWDAESGSELVRLLTGPKFAVGVADIQALRGLARWLAERDHTHQLVDASELAPPGPLEQLRAEVSLLDALDVMVRLPETHRALTDISGLGQQRMREAGRMLQRLRSLVSVQVPDLMSQVVRELDLDIELAGHERWSAETSTNALANVYMFIDEVRNFLAVSEAQHLGAVLQWLTRTEQRDELASYVPPPHPGAVQLTTVHSAKGLEWDIVAIPNMSTGSFPASARGLLGWLSAGMLPDSLRGDVATRPALQWNLAATQQEFVQRMKTYQSENREAHAEEERRLVYVAITRARQDLLLTGSFWRGGKTPHPPAEPLRELAALGIISEFPAEPQSTEQPPETTELTVRWPLDPLGLRRGRVTAAAAAVSQNIRELPEDAPLDTVSALLLEEERRHPDPAVHILQTWQRVNASVFHEFIQDPQAQLLQLIRPVPQRPFRRTRIGNVFHDWVEERYTTPRGTAVQFELEELQRPVTAELSPDEQQELDALISTFEGSRWADRKPILVEEEITIPFAARRIVCKLDAVFESDGRIEIVDWKTGRKPNDTREQHDRFLQLDLYRIAYSQAYDVPLEQIDATLFFVRDNAELTSNNTTTIAELEHKWLDALGKLSSIQRTESGESSGN